MDQSALLSSYHTRLNALLQRVKSIEILLMNREEEIEREDFSSWKESKTQKLAMLQSIYDQQVAAKKEELEDLRPSLQEKPAEPRQTQTEKPVAAQPAHPENPEKSGVQQMELKEIQLMEEPAQARGEAKMEAEAESSDDDDL